MYSCSKNGENKNAAIPYSKLCNGDIVFRRGISFSSNIILSKSNDCLYSHIGIVYKKDTTWCVIHAVNDEPEFDGDFDRIKIDKIEDFFAPERASAGAIYHSWLEDSISKYITNNAFQMVQDSVHFDANFDLNDSKQMYCTEFIYYLYNTVGYDITEGRRTKVGVLCFPDEIIFPGDIQKNKKLRIYFEFQ